MTLIVTSSSDLQIKDPAEVMDYTIDWSDVLGADLIASGSSTVASGLTRDSEMHQGQTSTLWLSGGTNGVAYSVAVTIVTAGGRTWKRTMTISVGTRTV